MRRATGPVCENVMSSSKPDVHNISQRNATPPEEVRDTATVGMHRKFSERTDGQTDRHTLHNNSYPSRGEAVKLFSLSFQLSLTIRRTPTCWTSTTSKTSLIDVELALLIGSLSSHLLTATPTALVAMATSASDAEAEVVPCTSSRRMLVALDPRLHTT